MMDLKNKLTINLDKVNIIFVSNIIINFFSLTQHIISLIKPGCK
jgi:hypothetical protein